MPPIPSDIHEETSSLIDSLTRRQKDLEEFQIPRLRDFKGPAIASQQQYAAEIREDMELFAKNIKKLELLADDQDRPRERREVLHRAKEFSDALTQIRKDYRVAMLTSKRAVDSLSVSAREELLRSSAVSEKKYDEKSSDSVMAASNNVTEALRRTMTLMQTELERSVLSSQMLDQSTANLRATTTQHDTLTGLIDSSRYLVTALEKSDWLDRLLLIGGLCFFLLVVGFILSRRIFERSIRIIFWWTRFLPNFSDDAALLNADSEAAMTALATMTTSAITATATFLSGAPESGLSSMLASEDVASTPSLSITPDTDDAIQTLLETSSISSEPVTVSSMAPEHEEL